MKKAIHILIVDDHKLIRTGLTMALNHSCIRHTITEAVNGKEALQKVAKEDFDLILMDISMPEMNGIEATRRIKRLYEDLPILAISMHTDEEDINQMMLAGASGYVFKDHAYEELEDAIRAALAGERFYSESVLRAVV